ncbi:MAG: OstA family protein [Chitinophagaceae bacterium]|nr:OstA family protein [Chitinophagaceae bacterium]
MRILFFFFALLPAVFMAGSLAAQEPVKNPAVTTISPQATADSLTDIEILGASRLTILKVDDTTTLQILAGNVRLKQGKSFFSCDSCVLNNGIRFFEAWGNVHINDVDTVDVYAGHLRYFFGKKLAFLDGGVKLTDGKGTLTTPDLEYDLNTEIGIYRHGGKVVNKKTVLTSQEGWYYANIRDIYFKKNVEMKDPGYFIKTDSLLYNTQSQTTRFIAETFIRDSSGRTIETKDGYYNMVSGKAEFGKRPVIRDKKTTIIGDEVAFNDSLGTSQARGNVVIVDSAQGTTILAGEVFRDNKKERLLATRKPLMIIKQENDSIYVTADTLFSARLSDLYAGRDSVSKDMIKGVQVLSIGEKKPIKDSAALIPGSVPGKAAADSVLAVLPEKKDSLQLVKIPPGKDSTDRYFEAYRNVRIFSDSMQAVSDSLFYSFRDSVFRLFQDPVLWSKESQITGDTVLLFTKNKKADRVRVFENSFLVNYSNPEIFNQVKSIRMEGWFREGNIDSVRAEGYAECIYYIQDEDSAYTGINESKSDIIDIFFAEKELDKVVFRSEVEGTIWPMKDKSPTEMRLKNFRWLESRRPKTKYELFE